MSTLSKTSIEFPPTLQNTPKNKKNWEFYLPREYRGYTCDRFVSIPVGLMLAHMGFDVEWDDHYLKVDGHRIRVDSNRGYDSRITIKDSTYWASASASFGRNSKFSLKKAQNIYSRIVNWMDDEARRHEDSLKSKNFYEQLKSLCDPYVDQFKTSLTGSWVNKYFNVSDLTVRAGEYSIDLELEDLTESSRLRLRVINGSSYVEASIINPPTVFKSEDDFAKLDRLMDMTKSVIRIANSHFNSSYFEKVQELIKARYGAK